MKPDFLVIGAMKAGTSSLYGLLQDHPDVYMCPRKDDGFFSIDSVYNKGWPWYESLFADVRGETAVGEVSVSYTRKAIFPRTVERIQRHLPDAKFVYMVRDPLRRMESHYLETQKRRSHKFPEPFSEAIQKHPMFLETSLYWKQLSWYREVFPEERFLVIFFEDFVNDPQSALSRVFAFLGVDPECSIGDTAAPNPSFGAWKDRPVNRLLRRVPLYDRIDRRKIPSWARNLIRPFLKSPIVERPVWEETARQWAVDRLSDDARQLLEYCRKPSDYWKL